MACRSLGRLERGLSSYRLLTAQEAARLGGTPKRHQYVFSVIFINNCGGEEEGGGGLVGREILLIPLSRVRDLPQILLILLVYLLGVTFHMKNTKMYMHVHNFPNTEFPQFSQPQTTIHPIF